MSNVVQKDTKFEPAIRMALRLQALWFWPPNRKYVRLNTAYVNCVAFLPLNRFFYIDFGLRFFCTLKLTIFWLMFLFSCVYVLLICSYLLITGCKIVQIKTNTFGRSNDNSSKYYIYCQPTLQRA